MTIKKIINTLSAMALGLMGATPALAEDGASSPWSLDIGTIYLHRSNTANVPLVLRGFGGPPVLSTGQIDDLGSFGGVFDLNGEIGGRDVHFRGIFTDQASDVTSIAIAPASTLIFATSGVPNGLALASGVTASRRTSLASLEANVTIAEYNNLSFFAGARGLQINDNLNVTQFLGAAPFAVGAELDNTLLGVQVGAELEQEIASVPGLTVGVTGKLGAFHNDIDTNGFNRLAAGASINSSASSSETSFAAEVGLKARYELNESLEFSAEYMFLGVTNVGEAGKSYNASDIRPQLQRIATDDAMYNGLKIGLVFKF